MTNTFKLFALASALIVAAGANAYAKTLSTTADVKVRNALTLSEVQKANFGVIEKPSTNVAIQLTTSGASGAGTTATFIDSSSLRAGRYTIAGSSLSSVNISATSNDNVPGISFSAITGDYGSSNGLNLVAGATNLEAPTASGKELKVGGTMTVASTVTEGDYAPGFTIVANYN